MFASNSWRPRAASQPRSAKVEGAVAELLRLDSGLRWPPRKTQTDPDTKPRRVRRPACGGLKLQRAPAKQRGRRGPTLPRAGYFSSSGFSVRLQSLSGAEQRLCGDKLAGRPSSTRRLPQRPHLAPPPAHLHTRHPRRAGAAGERRRTDLKWVFFPTPHPRSVAPTPRPGRLPPPSCSYANKNSAIPSRRFDFGHLQQIIRKGFQKVGNVT